jgi:hypothetical protein
VIEIVNRATGELLDADSVPGLARIAALHDEQLEQLEATIEELLADRDTPTGGTQRPVVWAQLTPTEAHRTWRTLAAWVGWLRGRYPLANQVPMCWWRHPELVEELTAVWLAWRDAYVEKGAPLTAGADWHARVLPEFLRRIGAGGWNIACEVDHRPRVTSLYDARPVDDPDAFDHHITATTPPPEAPQQEDTMNQPTMDQPTMDQPTMDRAVATGAARRVGELPGSPVAQDGRYWWQDGDQWVQIRSAETTAFLDEAQRRLALADESIQRNRS